MRYRAEERVGCFHCVKILPAGEIVEWWNEKDADECTAVCPRCGIDSIVSVAEVLPLGISEPDFATFLKEMRAFWFGGRRKTG